ncbi:shikimate dehydrogenase (NADP(+)) [Brevibacillus reuszeri]|uniref:Shikimate dehydrogenase (NADP(+)) n=1 Tax=Brevibacillus reuszeri TaxID=54915 RepID=A0A0K9YZG6_9BACL|nr:shikimate dehydrogenase [Brevibacillus reuszeri]KNB74022.1 shikimate dehydrogenase [Brevibacillus reuszeri]MED1859805.1 shikimate dehydrogenase [Brevibacillus reuszeri]GED72401.1 shikimate dehydrogenase (NADP(+)) [Brevibacillus reuszeri]
MITSKTQLVGLFGHPVSHSQSPMMHNAAFAEMGLGFAYVAFDVEPANLEDAVAGIRALGLKGINVTIPHKVAIMPMLDEIDPLAKRIGAVNTVVINEGRLIGYNTDGMGYVRSLVEETGIVLDQQTVTMVGAGGAARAVAFTLAEKGVKEIRIINRSRERAAVLAEHVGTIVPTKIVEQGEGKDAIADSSLLINTTSIGMLPHVQETPVPTEWLHNQLTVSDLIYNPLETRLLSEARAIGATVHSGVGMFVNQGALAFELWTGQLAPTEIMREIVLQQLQKTT